jgi:anthranilate synthase component 1
VSVQPSREALRRRFEASGGDPPALLPVYAEVLCDADTPVGAFARLRSLSETRFLLESVVGGERWARYSFVGLGHRMHVRAWPELPSGASGRSDGRQGPTLEFEISPGPGFELPSSVPERGRGVDVLRSLIAFWNAPPAEGLPRFWGGLVGVWGHDFVRSVERLPLPERYGEPPLPAVELLATDTMVIFDNLTQRVQVVATACPQTDGGFDAAYDAAAQRVERICEALRSPEPHAPSLYLHEQQAGTSRRCVEQATHMASVERAKEYIEAGDVFQVVVSQGFEVDREDVDTLDVYRILRVTNPAPYMYMMELPAATLVGASPEVLVRVDRDNREVTVRPIAGTRRRGRDRAEDLALERELLSDEKERAEHLMLIDLGRNDVGRVSDGGSVRMTESFAVERYSRVMHIVSEVTGRLRPELDALDALQATFPAGTLSGAPKVRALQIIDELEPAHRGWYGGAVGYLGYDGGADFAICIRSAVAFEDRLRVQAGGGIVYDSDPLAEDEECQNKAAAVLRAIAMAKHARSRGGEAT